jgi:hypothetical protein
MDNATWTSTWYWWSLCLEALTEESKDLGDWENCQKESSKMMAKPGKGEEWRIWINIV